LKNAKFEIPETPATAPNDVGPCAAIPANPQASAAQVIHAIATACGINPRVLIVTLQKEQGLVTSTKPTEYMYRAAMGFGCPDSDPAICGKVFVGQTIPLVWQSSGFVHLLEAWPSYQHALQPKGLLRK
jgi:hypothetical protein